MDQKREFPTRKRSSKIVEKTGKGSKKGTTSDSKWKEYDGQYWKHNGGKEYDGQHIGKYYRKYMIIPRHS